MSTLHYRERTERLEVHRRAYIEHGSPPAREPVPDPELLPEWMTVPGASCPWPRQPGAWSCALVAVDPSPLTSRLRADLDALRAELVTLAAAPAARRADGARGGRPSSRRPQRSSPLASAATVEDTLARADSMRAALDNPRRAWWGAEGARLARAIEAARWDADVARRGRAAAGPPPWGEDKQDELRAEAPEPPPEPEPNRASASDGSQLQALREAAGLSQAALAARIAPGAGMAAGAARKALSRIECGKGGPREVLDAALAELLRPMGRSQ